MSKITQHRTRIKKRYNYSKSSLEQGMIVEMTYKRRVKKGDPTRLETKKYMIVVLNPIYKGYLHGISLENVSSVQLNRLGKDWGLDNVQKGSAIITEGILTGLRIPKIEMKGSSGRFYSAAFAKTKPPIIDSYRTFDIRKVGSVVVVDYEWDKPVFNQQFAEQIEAKKLEMQLESEAALEKKKKKAIEKAKKPTNK